MWSEEIFNVATAYCMAMGAFFHEVVKDLGTDQALAMLIEPRRRFFRERARRVQQFMKRQEFDLNAFAGEAEKMWQQRGFDSLIKPTSTSLISTTRNCPFYAGFLAAGVDHNTIEAFCRGKDEAGDAQYKQFVGPYAGLNARAR